MAGTFLRQIERAKEAARTPAPTTAKPPEEMTDSELEQAVVEAERKVREARIAEVHAARDEVAQQQRGPRTLAGVLREKQRGKKKYWR